jgi:hypothetical protein
MTVSKQVERPGTKEPLYNHQRNVLSSCSHWYWSIATLHLMESNHEILIIQSAPYKPVSWFRFIDDVDMKWTESEENLNRFFDHANNVHPTIKFTHETSRNNICGLFVGADAFDSESLAVRNTFSAMFRMTTLLGQVLVFIRRFVVCSWPLDNHTKTPRTVQNLQRTTRLGFQETQNFEKYIGESLHLPSIGIQWSMSNIWRCMEGEVCNLHRFCGHSSVYYVVV